MSMELLEGLGKNNVVVLGEKDRFVAVEKTAVLG